MFYQATVAAINKQIRIMRHTATSIDHVFTSSFISTEEKSAFIKIAVLYHFPKLFVT